MPFLMMVSIVLTGDMYFCLNSMVELYMLKGELILDFAECEVVTHLAL